MTAESLRQAATRIRPYALRYFLGAYALTVVATTVAMLLGAAAMFLGGVGTPTGDIAFGIAAVVGFLVGLIPGFMALLALCRKDPLNESRTGALGAGCFFSLLVMLVVGIAITNSIELKLGRLPLPVYVLLISLTGGVPAAFCAVAFMTYQDAKRN